MGLQIESGAGNGASVTVTDDGRINTSSRSTSRLYFQSRVGNRAFSWQSLTYNYTGGDTILLVKNTNSNLSLVIHQVIFGGDTASLWHVHIPDTVATPTGTAVVGKNLNTNFGAQASATAIADETTNTQGDIIYSAYLPANTMDEGFQESLGDAVRLGNSESIAVDAVTTGTGAVCTIIGYFETDSPVAA